MTEKGPAQEVHKQGPPKEMEEGYKYGRGMPLKNTFEIRVIIIM